MFPAPTQKGTAPFRGHRTWFRVTGDLHTGRTPLVVAHGGPGSTHDYLLRMTELAASTNRPVIHYDQIGNGGSTRLHDRGADFWTVDLFLAELDNLLAHLGIADDYLLFGQSWGGMLGAEHAVRRPAGLRGLVIANSPASMPLWRAACEGLKDAMPPVHRDALRRHEATEAFDHPEYQRSVYAFYQRHVCRANPLPREVAATLLELQSDPTVYGTMNGPNDFHVIGTLKDWTVIDRLPAVAVPTLIISGAYDEATPATIQPFLDHIPGARWELFEQSSHMPHVEEPERFDAVMKAWLAEVG
ncbi:proline iminopeptidase-family hydrolase [Streptomyces sp. H39-S7]|uniref:proline iminopeptidase-family hydrolase n=1 Tax=Streptomyces sp. H39-S7 TaxID=3004357 RepID=UPI0022AF9CFD|nr:proline iminopeptidase-family hydrolase [Streptomyces sp. H39-S7]MCZ4123205.1 proline iminopeptidase-family hydrolase [Streptomyces sp. H39-S7]